MSTQPLSNAARRVASASNDLGFGLLRELLKTGSGENLIVSPFGLSLALAVLCNGAGSQTRQILRDALGARDLDDTQFNESYLSLRRLLEDRRAGFLLNVASALWTRKELNFNDAFVDVVLQYYEAEIASLDFSRPAAIDIINRWAQQQSAGKTDNILNSNDVSRATDLILATIAYFKGSWADPFNEDFTHEAPFHLADGRSKQVPMMEQENSFDFYETPLFRAVRIPYEGKRLSMYLFLPARSSSPPALLKSADNQVFENWVASMEPNWMTVYLPRFKSKFEAEIQDHLTAMGLGVLFGGQADLSRMGLGGQFVDKIKLKGMIEVNEEGTEAAVATTVMLVRGPPPPSIVFDRPFVWAIRDDVSQIVIFAGQVMEV